MLQTASGSVESRLPYSVLQYNDGNFLSLLAFTEVEEQLLSVDTIGVMPKSSIERNHCRSEYVYQATRWGCIK